MSCYEFRPRVAPATCVKARAGEPPYSTDANLLHISYEGNALEDPWVEAADDIWTRSVDARDAPNEPEYMELEFEQGNPVALNGERLSPAVMLTKLNELGGKHGAFPLAPVTFPICASLARAAPCSRSSLVLFVARPALTQRACTTESPVPCVRDVCCTVA